MSVSDDARNRMQKTAEALQSDLAKVRTGRAHAGLLDAVVVNAYGAQTPLAQVATVSIADPRTLVIAPWDPQNAAAIEKAVRESDLGVNPAMEGQRIRVNLPQLLRRAAARPGQNRRKRSRNRPRRRPQHPPRRRRRSQKTSQKRRHRRGRRTPPGSRNPKNYRRFRPQDGRKRRSQAARINDRLIPPPPAPALFFSAPAPPL